MAEMTVNEPEKFEKKKVDQSGKVYIGNKWAGMEASIIVEKIAELDDE